MGIFFQRPPFLLDLYPMFKYFNLLILVFVFISGCDPGFDHDIVIRNGTIVDGSGAFRFQGDIAINGNSISSVGSVNGTGKKEIDAAGKIKTMKQRLLSLVKHYLYQQS